MNKIFKREKVTFIVLGTTKCCHSFACFMSGLSSGTRLSKSVSFFTGKQKRAKTRLMSHNPLCRHIPSDLIPFTLPSLQHFLNFPILQWSRVNVCVWECMMISFNCLQPKITWLFRSIWRWLSWLMWEDSSWMWVVPLHGPGPEWCKSGKGELNVNIWFCSPLWTVVVKGPTLVAVTSLMWWAVTWN